MNNNMASFDISPGMQPRIGTVYFSFALQIIFLVKNHLTEECGRTFNTALLFREIIPKNL